MPKTRPLTESMRKEEAEKAQRQRVIRIISTAMEAHGFDRQTLAYKSGMDIQALGRRLRGSCDFSLTELCRIADALSLDGQCRAALCGARERCRFEVGYRGSGVN